MYVEKSIKEYYTLPQPAEIMPKTTMMKRENMGRLMGNYVF